MNGELRNRTLFLLFSVATPLLQCSQVQFSRFAVKCTCFFWMVHTAVEGLTTKTESPASLTCSPASPASLLQQMIESPLVTAMSQAFSAFVIIFLFDWLPMAEGEWHAFWFWHFQRICSEEPLSMEEPHGSSKEHLRQDSTPGPCPPSVGCA